MFKHLVAFAEFLLKINIMLCAEKVYTLADLKNWERREPSFAVLGKPIAHSLSPKMHNAAFSALRERKPQLADWRYFRFEIAPEELADALPLFFEKNFHGLNLTIPHKVAALPVLKKLSPEAEIIGAANTLVRDDALGGWSGENTDGRGFARAAEMQLGATLTGTHIVLLGAGGAARAIAATALAQNCASLTIVNRSRERAEALIADLCAFFPKKKISFLSTCDIQNLTTEEPALIVNATSLGLKPADASPFPPELLRADMSVYDTTYGTHTSALVAAARDRNLPAADGRSMLAWQGALAFELWTGVPAADAFPLMFRELS